MKSNICWWSPEYGFFGEYYIEGDNSINGYLTKQKQSLEERTSEEVSGVIQILNLKGKEKILDIPCGYGRHSINLAKEGFRVTGCDLNAIHLSIANDLAKKMSANVVFKQVNMIDMSYEKEFDILINMFYSFGFFNSDSENEKVAQKFFNSLKPDGKFLMHTDVNIPMIKSGRYKFKENRLLRNGKNLRIIDSYNSKTKRINGSWVVGDLRKDYSVRVYEVEEFVALCKKVGFKDVKVYSDWGGSEYNETSEMVIFVAEK